MNYITVTIINPRHDICSYMSSSTSLRQTPESITVCIFSLGPSDRYDRAQQASASTSGSLLNSSLDRTLRHGDTWHRDREGGYTLKSNCRGKNCVCSYHRLTFAKSGGGFLPLQRLDRAHTALRVVVSRLDLARSLDVTEQGSINS